MVIEPQPLDVLVLDLHVIVVAEIPSKRRQPERRKQRVLDRPEERARRLRESGQDQLDLHAFEDRAGRLEWPDGKVSLDSEVAE
jgi:hypothetical protein